MTFVGRGEYVYANGDVFEGEWQDGKKHGPGRLRSKDGALVREGRWEHDNFEKGCVLQ